MMAVSNGILLVFFATCILIGSNSKILVASKQSILQNQVKKCDIYCKNPRNVQLIVYLQTAPSGNLMQIYVLKGILRVHTV